MPVAPAATVAVPADHEQPPVAGPVAKRREAHASTLTAARRRGDRRGGALDRPRPGRGRNLRPGEGGR